MNSFMDKVKSKLNEGVNVVSVKSKNLIEITKINTQINTLESNVKNTYEELGKNVYMMFGNSNMDMDIIEKSCAKITELQKNIEEKKDLIKQIQEVEQDTLVKLKPQQDVQYSCKCEENTQTQEPVPASTSENENTKLCECGAIIRESAKFCSNCGRVQGRL